MCGIAGNICPRGYRIEFGQCVYDLSMAAFARKYPDNVEMVVMDLGKQDGNIFINNSNVFLVER